MFQKYKGVYIGLLLVLAIWFLYFALNGRATRDFLRIFILFTSLWFGVSLYLALCSFLQSLFFKLAFSELKKVEFVLIFSRIFPVMVFFMFYHFPIQAYGTDIVVILFFASPVIGSIVSYYVLSWTFAFRFDPGLNLKTLRRLVFVIPGLVFSPNAVLLSLLCSAIVRVNLEWFS